MTSKPLCEQDPSLGWEGIAQEFIAARDQSDIGVEVLQAWAGQLPDGGRVLDLGCGTGVPISETLIDAGLYVYAVDASPTLAAEFAQRFPQARIACEPVESSDFFGLRFDGIVAVGLMFLLPEDSQRRLIVRIASALSPGGRFLFTSPAQVCTWADLMTGRESRSLGECAYSDLLEDSGLELLGQRLDEGGNCYFDARKYD